MKGPHEDTVMEDGGADDDNDSRSPFLAVEELPLSIWAFIFNHIGDPHIAQCSQRQRAIRALRSTSKRMEQIANAFTSSIRVYGAADSSNGQTHPFLQRLVQSKLISKLPGLKVLTWCAVSKCGAPGHWDWQPLQRMLLDSTAHCPQLRALRITKHVVDHCSGQLSTPLLMPLELGASLPTQLTSLHIPFLVMPCSTGIMCPPDESMGMQEFLARELVSSLPPLLVRLELDHCQGILRQLPDLALFSRLGALRELMLRGLQFDQHANCEGQGVPGLERLQRLSLTFGEPASGVLSEASFLPALSSLQGLTCLQVQQQPGKSLQYDGLPSSWTSLGSLTNLVALDYCLAGPDPEGTLELDFGELEALARLPHLEVLRLHAFMLEYEELARDRGRASTWFSRLRELRLDGLLEPTWRVLLPNFVAAGQLTSLQLCLFPEDADYGGVGQLTALRDLDLGFMVPGPSDQNLKAWGTSLVHLTELRLASDDCEADLDDVSMAVISRGFPSLKVLKVESMARVTAMGVQVLCREHAGVHSNGVWGGLQQVVVTGCGMGENEVQAVEEILLVLQGELALQIECYP